MPDMPNDWQHAGGGIQDTDDGGGTDLSVSVKVAGAVPGMQSGGRDRVAADTPSESTRNGKGLSGGGYPTPPPPPGCPHQLGLLPQNSGKTTLISGGVSWGGKQTRPTSGLTLCTATWGTQL